MHLTEKHHALLFACLARQAIQLLGETDGEKFVREAVRRYGEQRGRRMAQRAQRDGQPLTFATYLRYGEWRSATREGASEMTWVGEVLVNRVTACPWHNAWLENDLLPYGRLYCLEIDLALVRGFNTALRLEVNQTLSNGGERCEFIFHQTVDDAGGHETQVEVTGAVMPWGYHCAHIYHVFQTMLAQTLGLAGLQAASAARVEFGQRFGSQALEEMDAYLSSDFDRLPSI